MFFFIFFFFFARLPTPRRVLFFAFSISSQFSPPTVSRQHRKQYTVSVPSITGSLRGNTRALYYSGVYLYHSTGVTSRNFCQRLLIGLLFFLSIYRCMSVHVLYRRAGGGRKVTCSRMSCSMKEKPQNRNFHFWNTIMRNSPSVVFVLKWKTKAIPSRFMFSRNH